jgi:two-component system, NtrC family, sensor kinase
LVPIALSDRERGEPSALTFAVGLNLASLCQRLVEVKPERGEIALFDRWNRAVCSTRGAPALQSADPELRGFLLPGSGNYQRQVEGQRFRGTVAAVLDGWRVVVEQPQDVISSPTLVLRNRALLWLCIGAAAAVASGLILSGSIYRPLQLLTAGVREIGTGNLGFRLQTASNDEFAQLARAFNTMSQGIAERDAEIREWNAKLQARVEKRGKQLKAAQDALLRSQKMAGLSTLVAGVAHEMNNPLTGILGLSQVLWGRGRKQGTDSSELELLGSIVTEAKRMQRLLSRMQALSDTVNTEDFREVKVGRLLDGVLLAARARMRELGIELFVDFKHGQATVLGDQYQLNQVFHGIVDNSLKAMTDQGGTLSVSTSSPDGDWIVITVSDTGHGIKEEQLEKVIEPFFTTKQGGAGDGLGLSLTYQAVRAHGGNLEVRSEWGKGTEVEVRLPAIRVGAHLA